MKSDNNPAITQLENKLRNQQRWQVHTLNACVKLVLCLQKQLPLTQTKCNEYYAVTTTEQL